MHSQLDCVKIISAFKLTSKSLGPIAKELGYTSWNTQGNGCCFGRG